MRIAVVADIHGNLLALEAVLTDLRGRAVDHIINLGDCVSGPLWPAETASRLMSLGWPTIRGNHDRWVTDTDPEAQYPSDAFARRSLSSEHLAWLRGLPPTLRIADRVYACHGRPENDNAYLLENVVGGQLALASRSQISERIGAIGSRVLLCGHSHIPRIVSTDTTVIVNPGSVGQPAYEDTTQPAHISETGSPHARYAILNIIVDQVEVEMISVSYDHIAAAKRAEQAGNSAWVHFLSTGFATNRVGL